MNISFLLLQPLTGEQAARHRVYFKITGALEEEHLLYLQTAPFRPLWGHQRSTALTPAQWSLLKGS